MCAALRFIEAGDVRSYEMNVQVLAPEARIMDGKRQSGDFPSFNLLDRNTPSDNDAGQACVLYKEA